MEDVGKRLAASFCVNGEIGDRVFGRGVFGVAFEYGNTSFFVEVPTSNAFFRLLCLTERIFTAGPQLPAR